MFMLLTDFEISFSLKTIKVFNMLIASLTSIRCNSFGMKKIKMYY